MTKRRTALAAGLVALALTVGWTVVDHEAPTRIMFDAETDGPALVERNRSAGGSGQGSQGYGCATIMITAGGSVPVLTTCSTTAAQWNGGATSVATSGQLTIDAAGSGTISRSTSPTLEPSR